MKKLYLHVGLPKTGTSSLQFFLQQNNNILKCFFNGCYPNINPNKKRDPFNDYLIINGNFMFFEAHTLKFKSSIKRIIKNFKKRDFVIISEENISFSIGRQDGFCHLITKNLELLRETMKKINVEVYIILYIRRQDNFIDSIMAESLKNGAVRSFNKTCSFLNKTLDYYFVANEFNKIFPNSIIVRNFDNLLKHDIKNDFLHVINLDIKKFKLCNNINERVEPNALFFLKKINSNKLLKDDIKKMLVKLLLQIKFSHFNASLITIKQAENIMKKSKPTNMLLQKKYFRYYEKPLFDNNFNNHKNVYKPNNKYLITDVLLLLDKMLRTM